MNTLEVQKTNIDRVARTNYAILADENGNLPTEIEVLKCGMWITPWHGDFMIAPDDLVDYVNNFDNGIGIMGAGVGAPIDFSHDNHKEAAGWIKSLKIDGESLIATVEWSTAGRDALLGGLYRGFSPEFYPRGRGGWENPERAGEMVDNVLVGGGLTNKPLFKGLSPVMASEAGNGDDNKNVIYIKASEKESIMDLEALRVKDVNTLTDEEKDFISNAKDQLTTDERVKFGLEAAPVKNEDEKKEDDTVSVEDQELAGVAASIKSGEMVVIKASELAEMKRQTTAYARERAEATVKAHIARGAIKADQLGTTVDRLLSDETFGTFLDTLPSNEITAGEIGSDSKATNAVTATDKLDQMAKEAMANDKGLSYSQAISNVLASDAGLAKEYELEVKGVK